MTTLLAVLSYGITAVALALITFKARQIYRIIKSGQPDPTRGGNPAERARTMVSQVLLHTKMKKFTPSGIAHWFVMIGFVALFGSLVQAYGEVLSPTFTLPLIGNRIVYRAFVMLIAGLTVVGLIFLLKVGFWNMWVGKNGARGF